MPASEFLGLTMREAGRLAHFYEIEQRRIDARYAPITTWYAEVHRDRDKRHDPFRPADFFPSLKEVEKIESINERERVVARMMRSGATREAALEAWEYRQKFLVALGDDEVQLSPKDRMREEMKELIEKQGKVYSEPMEEVKRG